jgi:hypothetical protein
MIRIKQHFKLYKYFFMLIFCLHCNKSNAQNQKVADSLKLIYKQNNVSGLKNWSCYETYHLMKFTI